MIFSSTATNGLLELNGTKLNYKPYEVSYVCTIFFNYTFFPKICWVTFIIAKILTYNQISNVTA
jgi:hypothetical protein